MEKPAASPLLETKNEFRTRMNDDCGDFEGVFDRADACVQSVLARGLHASWLANCNAALSL